ncbi:MAG: hypothetical protein HW404_368 [Anaerolineales bacterium]|nr:hypothetical protein [Anaerolineales bacterium]MBM2842531.1 hypothetical protein [Anaerolineales bacterium]
MTIAPTKPRRSDGPARPPAEKSLVTQYAEDVVRGRLVTGRLVRLACERHLRDLKQGHKRGIHFDAEAAARAIGFFGILRHSKGEWAGQVFELALWQAFIVGSVFGWMRADGTRRFRTALEEVARKNGKTTMLAGVGLLLAFFDGEPGAEVYAAATKRDQAKICWSEAKRMVQKTPALKSRIQVLTANLHNPATASKFEPLGADGDTTEGLNPHGAIVDELHAHKTRAMVDVLEEATGARRQPLIFHITTAGFNRNSVCYEYHDYSIKVLEGIIDDDTWFAYIAAIDELDEWTDPKCWIKANPNLGISVKLDNLERRCEQAKEAPGRQNAFKRMRLNVWTEQAERWLDMAVWDENDGACDLEDLYGQPCFAGLDMSSTTDLTALELAFPDPDETEDLDVLSFFWCPKEGVARRARVDHVPYDVWVEQGHIEATEGNVVDYDHVRRRLNELRDDFDIKAVVIDRWNSTQLQTQLQGDGFNVVPMGQGYASMSAPTKELERRIVGRKVHHRGNPVLRWMASNVAAEQDAAGNIKPSKAKSTERIDGISALVMAVDQLIRDEDEDEDSVYDERGILEL